MASAPAQGAPADDGGIEDRASCCEMLFFRDFSPLIAAAGARRLETADVGPPRRAMRSAAILACFKAGWTAAKPEARANGSSAAVRAGLFAATRRDFWVGAIFGSLAMVVPFANPFLVEGILASLDRAASGDDDEGAIRQGIIYAACMFVVSLVVILCEGVAVRHNYRVAVGAVSGVVSAMYDHTLRLSNEARGKASSGEVMNYLASDAHAIFQAVPIMRMVWMTPGIIVVALILMFRQVGHAMWAGLAVMIISIPVNGCISGRYGTIFKSKIALVDTRLKLMTDLLNAVKLVKFYAWERSFLRRIAAVRAAEMVLIRAYNLTSAALMLSIGTVPVMVTLATFATYAAISEEPVTATTFFVTLSLLDILRMPMFGLPMAIALSLSAVVSLRRVQNFLLLPVSDAKDDPLAHGDFVKAGSDECGEELAVRIVDGNFYWQATDDDAEAAVAAAVTTKGGAKGSGGKGGGDAPAAGTAGDGGHADDDARTNPDASDVDSDDPDEDARGMLSDINLAVPKGSFVAIVGTVGSGKSSVLSALQGEMSLRSGRAGVVGRLGVVPQSAFILNATLKANIVMDRPWDAARYRRVIDSCALQPDLDMLPAGDATEIGERGLNLSGGQMARVNLARAVYDQSDVVLLDDILAAVDAHVGVHLLHKVVLGELAGRTRVFVTNQLSLVLPHADRVLVMEKGRIAEQGTYEELFGDSVGGGGGGVDDGKEVDGRDGGGEGEDVGTGSREVDVPAGGRARSQSRACAKLIRAHQRRERKAAAAKKAAAHKAQGVGAETPADVGRAAAAVSPAAAAAAGAGATDAASPKGTAGATSPAGGKVDTAAAGSGAGTGDGDGALVSTEARAEGAVSKAVRSSIVTAAGMGYTVSYFALLVISNAVGLGSTFWLSVWADPGRFFDDPGSLTTGFFVGVYAAWTLGAAVIVYSKEVVFAFGAKRAAARLHDALLHRVLGAPMAWFDVTPLGRVINRFSKDVQVVDGDLPYYINHVCTAAATASVLLTLTLTSTVWLIPLAIPSLWVYFRLQQRYRAAARDLQRLDNVTRSPVFAFISESMGGLGSIRTFRWQAFFLATNARQVDTNMAIFYAAKAGIGWMSVRSAMVGASVGAVVAVFVVLAARPGGLLPVSVAGLSLSLSLGLMASMNMVTLLVGEMDTRMTSLERMVEYATEVPLEEETVRPGSTQPGDQGRLSSPPQEVDGWQADGHIKFDRVAMRYRPGLPLVLRDISFETARRGEKLALVGRTGSGKSSLLNTILQMRPLAGGSIQIGGRDVTQVPLEQLRGAVSVIPQDPALFDGTLRFNLDPFGKHSDADLHRVLKLVRLDETFPLELAIKEGGSNVSLGQRQLLCIARALLRNSSIILMDEASASVDQESDALLQAMIRKEFSNATIVTIAHRIQTIMDYDRVMCCDKGEIVEIGPPGELRHKEGGVFAGLVRSAEEES